MTLNHFRNTEQSGSQMAPLKALESFYSLMMPIWAFSSNTFETSKRLHEEMIEVMQTANEDVTDRIVNAIDHNKPKELIGAITIASQTLGQVNLMAYNAAMEQHYQLMDTWFQVVDKGHQQAYQNSSKL